MAARRWAMIRKISLPASAHECAASASIDADAVMTAAALLATAMSRLAANATMTVRALSEPDGLRRRPPRDLDGGLRVVVRCVRHVT